VLIEEDGMLYLLSHATIFVPVQVSNFNRLFLKLNHFICNELPVLPEPYFVLSLLWLEVCLYVIENLPQWFKALAVKDSGVIYEDPYVQVGCSLIGEFLEN
jgi:hypothetical protein